MTNPTSSPLADLPAAMDRQAFETLQKDYAALRYELDRALTFIRMKDLSTEYWSWNFKLPL